MATTHGLARPRGPWPGITVAVAAALALHLGGWAVWAAFARPPTAGALPPRAGVLALRVIVAPAAAPRLAAAAQLGTPGRGLPSAAEPAAVHGQADHPPGAAASLYLPARLLDRPAVPKSEPDLSLLEGLSVSGLPIRLRLFIAATGEVSAAELLGASPDDAEAVQRIREMFLATAFVPGLRHGREVPSFKDVELRLEP